MVCDVCRGKSHTWYGKRISHTECWKRIGRGAEWLTSELGETYIRHDPVPPA